MHSRALDVSVHLLPPVRAFIHPSIHLPRQHDTIRYEQRTNASKTLDFPLDCDPTTAIWGKSIPFPPRTPAVAKMSCKRFTSGTKPLPSVCCRPAPPSADARTRWCDMVLAFVYDVRAFVRSFVRSSGRRCQRRTARGLMSHARCARGDKWQLLLKLPSGNIGTYVDGIAVRGYSTSTSIANKHSSYEMMFLLLYSFVRAMDRERGARVQTRLVGWLFFRKPNEYFAGERVERREPIVPGWGDFFTRCTVCDENLCALDGDVEDFGGEKPYSSNGD